MGPHLNLQLTDAKLCPVGIDYLTLQTYLHDSSVTKETFSKFRRLERMAGQMTIKEWRHVYQVPGSAATITFILSRHFYTRAVTLPPAGTGPGLAPQVYQTREWLLTIRLNPSMFMHQVVNAGSEQGSACCTGDQSLGRNNYSAGSAEALAHALSVLDSYLETFGFADLQGEPLHHGLMRIGRIDLTRDLLLSSHNVYLLDGAIDEALQFIRTAAPPHVPLSKDSACRDVAHYLNSNFAEADPDPDELNGVFRKTKREIFSCYRKRDPNPGTRSGNSQKLRFEFRLHTAGYIHRKLGLHTVADVLREATAVTDWHTSGRQGALPRFEAFVEQALNRMLTDRAAVATRKRLPVASQYLLDLLALLGESDDIEYMPPWGLEAGRRITPDVADDIQVRLNDVPLNALHQAAEIATGYAPKTSSNTELHQMTQTLPPRERERRRQAKVQLLEHLQCIRSRTESPFASNVAAGAVTWAQHRAVLRDRVLWRP